MLSTVLTTSTRGVVIGIENRTQNVDKSRNEYLLPSQDSIRAAAGYKRNVQQLLRRKTLERGTVCLAIQLPRVACRKEWDLITRTSHQAPHIPIPFLQSPLPPSTRVTSPHCTVR